MQVKSKGNSHGQWEYNLHGEETSGSDMSVVQRYNILKLSVLGIK